MQFNSEPSSAVLIILVPNSIVSTVGDLAFLTSVLDCVNRTSRRLILVDISSNQDLPMLLTTVVVSGLLHDVVETAGNTILLKFCAVLLST